jgi:hypothetical protein
MARRKIPIRRIDYGAESVFVNDAVDSMRLKTDMCRHCVIPNCDVRTQLNEYAFVLRAGFITTRCSKFKQ